MKGILTCDEDASALYKGTLVDENGIGVHKGQITDMRLTLYNPAGVEPGIINGRDGSTNVLDDDTSGVTMHLTSGEIQWQLSPEDNPIVNPTTPFERHIALLTFSFGDNGRGHHEILLHVRSRRKVAAPVHGAGESAAVGRGTAAP